MSFISAHLKSTGALGAGRGIWFYDTEDADVTTAGYFNAAARSLEVGDRIMVTQFTDLNLDSAAYVASSEVVVTSNDRTTVEVE